MCKIFISVIIFCLSCFGIVGKKASAHGAIQDDQGKDFLVTDDSTRAPHISEVFTADPVTGELTPASICYECESYLRCLGYVNEKNNQKMGKPTQRPCEVTPLETLPFMGLQVIKDMCVDCDYPRNCTNCPLKWRSGFVMDCQSCDAEEICEGIEIAEDPNNPEMLCGMLSDVENVSNPDDNDIPF